MKNLTCGFIGLGLIGGSVAKALRLALPGTVILAYDSNDASLKQALAEKVADRGLSGIDDSFLACDYVFLCAPVDENDENLLRLKPFLSASCVLTDVGSVKGGIHRHIDALGLSDRFIGGHPMAGSERTGYSNSRERLLENAYYILTPSPTVPEEKVAAFQELLSAIGAIPLVMEAKRHDRVTAAVSHLPHIAAASLVNLVRASDSPDGIMKMIAAGGFKDITRIASSSPGMWQQICLTNSEPVCSFLESYIAALGDILTKIKEGRADELYRFFDEARQYRDSFIDAPSGPIKKSSSIRVEIADEPGALASIATILALNGISIKNIGIVHNREFEEGVLRIEFYEDAAVRCAVSILTGRGYTIYEKK